MAEEKQFSKEEARQIGDELNINWQQYSLDEFVIGLGIEMEHGPHDPQTDVTGGGVLLTGKIAWAHLKEFPDYYSRLIKYFTDNEVKRANKVTIIAEINILHGYEKEVLAAAEHVWIETRKESGCDAFLFNTKGDRDQIIVFIEVFKSEEDFEFHKKAKHTADFLASLAGKVVGDAPHLTFLNQFID